MTTFIWMSRPKVADGLTYLSDVDGWVEAVTDVHHYGGTQVLQHKHNKNI